MAQVTTTIGKEPVPTVSYPWLGYGEDILPDAPVFKTSALEIVSELRRSMKGLGTNDKLLISIMSSHNKAQLSILNAKFSARFGESLKEWIDGDTSGNYQELLTSLITPPTLYLARTLYDGIHSARGTNERALLNVLCCSSPQQIDRLEKAYFRRYQRRLVAELMGDLSGDLERLVMSLMASDRRHDEHMDVRADVELMIAGAKGIGTDESAFFSVLCARPFEHARAVVAAYEEKTGKTLEQLVRSEFSGHTEYGLELLIHFIRSPAEAAAFRIWKAVKGLGTDDLALCSTIWWCYDQQWKDELPRAFQRLFGKTLEKAIKGDTSGQYRKLIMALLAYEPEEMAM